MTTLKRNIAKQAVAMTTFKKNIAEQAVAMTTLKKNIAEQAVAMTTFRKNIAEQVVAVTTFRKNIAEREVAEYDQPACFYDIIVGTAWIKMKKMKREKEEEEEKAAGDFSAASVSNGLSVTVCTQQTAHQHSGRGHYPCIVRIWVIDYSFIRLVNNSPIIVKKKFFKGGGAMCWSVPQN